MLESETIFVDREECSADECTTCVRFPMRDYLLLGLVRLEQLLDEVGLVRPELHGYVEGHVVHPRQPGGEVVAATQPQCGQDLDHRAAPRRVHPSAPVGDLAARPRSRGRATLRPARVLTGRADSLLSSIMRAQAMPFQKRSPQPTCLYAQAPRRSPPRSHPAASPWQ